MANTVRNQALNKGPRNYVIHRVVLSDGTDETTQTVLDASALGIRSGACVKIQQVWWSSRGVNEGRLYFSNGDTTGDGTLALTFPGQGFEYLDFRSFGGITAAGDTSATGDITISTALDSGDEYTLVLQVSAS